MKRLDQALVEHGFYESREQAKRAVMAGRVRVNDQLACKPSDPFKETDRIQLASVEKYASRGGEKLEHALNAFHLNVSGFVAVDLGASTGGFTDCLLQHGAAKVFAVDVGQGQLAWKLRQDPRVVIMEKVNAREIAPGHFREPFSGAHLVTIDCSFISLRMILPAAACILKPGASVVALIKPQFEAGRSEANRGRGVIRNPAIHQRVIRGLREFVETSTPLSWRAETESPLVGPAGNKEFFCLLEDDR